jgi:hypothetical protein
LIPYSFGTKDYTVYRPASDEVLCQYRVKVTFYSSPSAEVRMLAQLFTFNNVGKIRIRGARRDDEMMWVGVRKMGIVTHRNHPYGITIPLFSLS